MTSSQIEHLFETYARCRMQEQWQILWIFVGAMMNREQTCEQMNDEVEELRAICRQQARSLDIIQEGHQRLYNQAHMSPINSLRVREALKDIDGKLREEIS